MPASRPSPSFQRVLTALDRREPDRVPLGEVWVDPEVKHAFLGHPIRGLEDEVAFWIEAGYDFVAVDTDLYGEHAIQEGIVRPLANTADTYAVPRQERNWVGSQAAILRNRQDVLDFAWPKAEDLDLSVYPRLGRLLPADMKAVVTTGHVFTAAWQLMGFEPFCYALHDDIDLVEEIMRRMAVETLRLIERLLDLEVVGAICFQDDIAYTNGLMIPPRHLRRLFFPWLRKAVDLCHAAGRPLILHSDGKVDEAIEDLLGTGIDALHPIEPKCMDIVQIKQRYGDRLALIGNLDLGYTLTRGTPEEVEAAVKALLRDVAPGGGFLLSSANSITNYVPLDNYRAMLDATLRYGRYPIEV
jgi:uroporphyrinogen decarboxylase